MSFAPRFLNLTARLSRNVAPFASKPQMRTIFGRNQLDINRDFQSLMRDMERTFNHLYRDVGRVFHVPRALPTITSTNEQGNVYRLNIDMTGFKPEDIKVSLKEQVLTIHAKMEHKNDNGCRFSQEVIRDYLLPEKLNVEGLKSQIDEDGVLRIEAPLPEPTSPHEIPIERQTSTKNIE